MGIIFCGIIVLTAVLFITALIYAQDDPDDNVDNTFRK